MIEAGLSKLQIWDWNPGFLTSSPKPFMKCGPKKLTRLDRRAVLMCREASAEHGDIIPHNDVEVGPQRMGSDAVETQEMEF